MRLFFAALSVFFLLGCATSPESPLVPCSSPYGIPLPDKPVFVAQDGLFCYVREAPANNARLRRALAACTRLELEIRATYSFTPRVCTLERGRNERLDATLRKLAAVPQWLGLRMYRSADIDPAFSDRLRLYNAEGKLLWEGQSSSVFYQEAPGTQPTCFLNALEPFLPFP